MPTPARPICLAALALPTALALAQDAAPRTTTEQDTPPAELEAQRKPPTFTLTTSGSYSPTADLDDGPGDLRITRVRAVLDVGIDLGERRSLALGIGSERSWYDFDGATELEAGGDPFSRVSDTEFFARYSGPLNDTTNWFALGAVGIAAEDGADISDSLVYTAGAGFVVQASPTFSWGVGAVVRTRLEDDALVLPIPQIRWAISDRWTLESQRAGLRLDYAHSDTFSYGLQGEYASRSFRLDDDGPIPDGMATDRRVPLSFYASYTPSPAVSLGASVGAALFSNIELLDDDGDKITDADVETAIFFGLNASIRF